MKPNEEVMEILEAFDLTGSYRAAGRLAGCDAKTVARYVALRDNGKELDVSVRDSIVSAHLDKIEELVERSQGDIRADVVHDKLSAMDYEGSARTTRRAVAAAKDAYERGHRRVFRPWVPEPGLWFQWDWGAGPQIWGRETQLWCAWLAWSRFRVIIPTWDKALPTVIACMDETLRAFGGVPTYALTDNEKTVTSTHICRIAVRNPDIVAASRHYGMVIHTCIPADPQSKGGSEATVRIAKADLVPTGANLLQSYDSFAELAAGCREAMDRFNAREPARPGALRRTRSKTSACDCTAFPTNRTRSPSARPAWSTATPPFASVRHAIRCRTRSSASGCGCGGGRRARGRGRVAARRP
jgi:transposase